MFAHIFLSRSHTIPSTFTSGAALKQVNNLWQMDGEKGSASNFNILPEINKSCFLIESDPHLERGSWFLLVCKNASLAFRSCHMELNDSGSSADKHWSVIKCSPIVRYSESRTFFQDAGAVPEETCFSQYFSTSGWKSHYLSLVLKSTASRTRPCSSSHSTICQLCDQEQFTWPPQILFSSSTKWE